MGSRGDVDQDSKQQFVQNVIVMRHGDRIDNFEPLWAVTAARPWDPPLVEAGKVRAYNTGRRIRDVLGFPIHRVFVSPFLRCIQTASAVVSALCSVEDDSTRITSHDLNLDPSRLKVSVEYGLCEMLNREAIRQQMAPRDGKFDFNISDSEAMLPTGTVDHNVERVYKELPKWEETVTGARSRYEEVFRALADKYPSENLLFVTHGEGVGVSVSAFTKADVTVYEVEYCAYSHLRRSIFFENQNFTAEHFEVLSSQSGVSYYPVTHAIEDAAPAAHTN